nr:ribonuclease H-like domain-containing protein [Tanacetum cinerariifolium]
MQKVWILVDLPYGKRAIGTKWVYKNKKDERGIVIRNKARLVAQGHIQEEGIEVFNSSMLHVLRVEMVINSPWMLSKNWLVQTQTTFGVNTPRSDEDRLKLMKLMVFLLQKGVCDEIGITVVRLSSYCCQANVQVDAAVAAADDVAHMVTPSPPPHGISYPSQEPSSPPHHPPCPPQPQDAEVLSFLFQQVLDTCFALARRVEGLENDKAAQQLEIVKLKARVKKLENINMGRIIADMDQDEGIKLVANQEKDAKVEGRHADKQAEVYNLDQDHSSKVLSMQEDDTEVQEAVE